MIVPGRFSSLWDGDTVITTDCRVDTDRRIVTDIEVVDVESLEVLDSEYVEFQDPATGHKMFEKVEFDEDIDGYRYN